MIIECRIVDSGGGMYDVVDDRGNVLVSKETFSVASQVCDALESGSYDPTSEIGEIVDVIKNENAIGTAFSVDHAVKQAIRKPALFTVKKYVPKITKIAGNVAKGGLQNAFSESKINEEDFESEEDEQPKTILKTAKEVLVGESTTTLSVGAIPVDFNTPPPSVKIEDDGTGSGNFKIILTDSGEDMELETGLPQKEAEELANEYRRMFAPDTIVESTKKQETKSINIHSKNDNFEGRAPMLSTEKLVEAIARGADVREAVGSYLSSRLLEDEDVAKILSPVDTAPGTTLPGVEIEDPEKDAQTDAILGPSGGIVPTADEFATDASVDSTELATKSEPDEEELASTAEGSPTVTDEFMESRRRRIKRAVRESLRKIGVLKEDEMPDFIKDKIDDKEKEDSDEDTPDQEEEPIEEPKIESRRNRLLAKLEAARRRRKKIAEGEESMNFPPKDEKDDEDEDGKKEDDKSSDETHIHVHMGESRKRRLLAKLEAARRRKKVVEEEGDGSGIAAADRLPGEELETGDEENENEGEMPVSEARRRFIARLMENRRRRINEEGEAGTIPPEDDYDEEDDENEDDFPEEPEEPMESKMARNNRMKLKESRRYRPAPKVISESIDNQFQIGESVSLNGGTGTITSQNPSALGYFYLVQMDGGPTVQAAHHELSRVR